MFHHKEMFQMMVMLITLILSLYNVYMYGNIIFVAINLYNYVLI
jgi:hypothetical protein